MTSIASITLHGKIRIDNQVDTSDILDVQLINYLMEDEFKKKNLTHWYIMLKLKS